MKKLLKLVFALAGILGFMSAANYLTFHKAGGAPAQTKNRRLFYDWRHGKISYTAAGRGRPILLLHSLFPGSSSAEWRRAAALLSKNHRVYSFDFLGCGFSDKPDISYSAYLYASLANDFIRDVIGQPAVVAGSAHSAPLAAAACQLRPELCEKLILVSPLESEGPVGSPSAFGTMLGRLIALPVAGTFLYSLAVSRRALGAFLNNNLAVKTNVRDDLLADFYQAAHEGGPDSRFSYGAFLSGFCGADCRQRLSKIQKPVLIINKKAGLFPHIDRPEEFCRTAGKFIDN
ncbi:MAG: alpha/beta fold hydrolase [Firmicutes bacterium]|nr:alpha/beta fold hydrolase [Bacillota bacterium]